MQYSGLLPGLPDPVRRDDLPPETHSRLRVSASIPAAVTVAVRISAVVTVTVDVVVSQERKTYSTLLRVHLSGDDVSDSGSEIFAALTAHRLHQRMDVVLHAVISYSYACAVSRTGCRCMQINANEK